MTTPTTADAAALIGLALARRGAARLAVTGSSMMPGLPPGSTVTVRAVDGDAVGVGSVVAFRFGRRVLVHRVLRRCGTWLFTAGDNLPLFDLPVAVADVLGVVTGVPPAPRRAVRWGAAPAAGPDHLWVFGGEGVGEVDARSLAERGWRVHRRPTSGAGVPAATVDEVRRATAGAPVLGVSGFGVLDGRALLDHPPPRGLHVLVGCGFGGELDPGRTSLLPPDLARVHVRLGAPAAPLPAPEAVRRLLHLLEEW